MIGMLAALQVASAAGSPPPSVSDRCTSRSSQEIVVCGSRSGQNPYRLPKLPEVAERAPLTAETDSIPGVHTRAHVESEGKPDGQVAKRLMVTFSIPF